MLKVLLLFAVVLQWTAALSLFNIRNSATTKSMKNDDNCEMVSIGSNFPFHGKNYTSFYFCENGIVSFDGEVTTTDTTGMPDSSALLPFWSDMNGYYVGERHYRGALSAEQTAIVSVIKANRGITNLNARLPTLLEWNEVSHCGCFYPRNTIQAALVTDGCAAYAVFAYPSVRWGNQEDVKVGVYNKLIGDFKEAPLPLPRDLKALANQNWVYYLGGENECTGKNFGDVVPGSNSNIYHVCGECSVAQTFVCEAGKTYHPQCGRCVIKGPPDCDTKEDGAFTPWENEGECSKTCGTGQQKQVRFCTNPRPSNGGANCTGPYTQSIVCKITECPIDGGYTDWSNGTCSKTCGNGLFPQTRTCTNPRPQFGGKNCTGPNTNSLVCNLRPCEIHGNWGAWEINGTCTKGCGGGIIREVRQCNDPIPQFGGNYCENNTPANTERFTMACNTERCPDICTNNDAADNEIVYESSNATYYCICLRTENNAKSYIKECIPCPTSTTYDPAMKACVADLQPGCVPDSFCAGKTSGNYSTLSGSSTASCSNDYYFCDANLQLIEKSCPLSEQGSYFDAGKRECVTGRPSSTCPNFACIGVPNGNYERLDDFCQTYRRCSNFITLNQTCPAFQPYYDQVQRSCQAGDEPPVGQNCVHPTCKGKQNGIYALDNKCDGGYVCLNERQTVYTTCQGNEYFNAVTGTCTTTYVQGCQNKFCRSFSSFSFGSFNINGGSCGNSFQECSGNSSPTPNILSGVKSCPPNEFFKITDPGVSNTAGTCTASPPDSSCDNYLCIGRPDGFRIVFSGINDCRSYFECESQVARVRTCAAGLYFDTNNLVCSASAFDETRCQHPDCLAGGRQAQPGVYPLTANNECNFNYYRCSQNLLRTQEACTRTLFGQHFGLLAPGVYGCKNGTAPTTCGLNYLCIGRIDSGATSPLYDNPSENYCTGFAKCNNFQVSYDSCPNGQFLDVSSYTCVSTFPEDQNCWRDGGYGNWSAWAYSAGGSCSVSCGVTGQQQQERTRPCDQPPKLGGGKDCVGDSIEYRNFTCELTLPPCDAFCFGKSAGSYSKSLELTPSINVACYRSYYQCTGPLEYLRTVKSCNQGEIFDPSQSRCAAVSPHSSCPFCAGKADGSYALSSTTHDCRRYVQCQNEVRFEKECDKDGDRPTYYNPSTQRCEILPQNNCNWVMGFWGEWFSDGQGCQIRNNGVCQSREIRNCDNPAAVNDNSGCSGLAEKFTVCSSCGDPFCYDRNGTYSKTLDFNSTWNFACFASYYQCNQPNNIKIELDCIEADTIYVPSKGGCFRQEADPECPNKYCGGKSNGYHALSAAVHDCTKYLNCTNDFGNILTCTNDPVTGKPRYFNNGVCSTVPPVNSNGISICEVVYGFWSEWKAVDSCSQTSVGCQRNETRTCSDPEPIADNQNPCDGKIKEDRIGNCSASNCLSVCQTQNPCHSSTSCTSTNVGLGYTCTCPSGYQRSSGTDGTASLQCIDINECLTSGICGSTRVCSNTAGSYTCLLAVCENQNPCHSSTSCTSTNVGVGYTCTCPSGYSRSSGTDGLSTLQCTDINECTAGTANCASNQVCVNTLGSFTCTAAVCQTQNPCHSSTSCTSTNVGVGYTCTCPSGYTRSSGTDGTASLQCTDVDECAAGTDNCASNQVCVNTLGSFVCNTVTNAETCAGKFEDYRISSSSNPREYQLCDGAGNVKSTQQCPNAMLSIGLDSNFDDITTPNGEFYHPIFKTCVNTTTGNPPPDIIKNANGQYNMTAACPELSNGRKPSGEETPVKFPYIYDTNCKLWITCFNGILTNEQIPPRTGDCQSQRFYGDARTCKTPPDEQSYKCLFA